MFFARIVSSFHDFSSRWTQSFLSMKIFVRHIPSQIFIVAYLSDTLVVVLVGVLNNSAMSPEAAAGSYRRI